MEIYSDHTSEFSAIIAGSRNFDQQETGLGRPMPNHVRREMEQRFCADFSAVRIHESPMPKLIDAAAFAWGEHLFFAPGIYQPETQQGRAILAHELAHVVQQRLGLVETSDQESIAIVDDPELEAEAEAAAEGNVSPRLYAAMVQGIDPSPVIQCIHYRNLAEVDSRYQNEEGSASAFRAPTNGMITRKERDLKIKLIQLGQLNSMLRRQSRGLGALTHKTQIAMLRTEIAKVEADVHQRKIFFEQQGFKLNPDGSVNWQASSTVVAYDHSPAATGNTCLRGSGGKLMWMNTGTEASTLNMTTFFKGVGYGIYVMSARGNIHLHGHSIGSYHHSSLLHGGNVAGAGEMQIDDNGNLKYLNNKSGHYKPSPVHLSQVIHQLRRMGVQNNFTVAEYQGRDFKEMSVTQFLAKDDDQHDIELIRLLDYSMNFTDPRIAGALGMQWKAQPEPGFYSTSSGYKVPHKIARKKLKAHGYKANETYFSGGQQITTRPPTPVPAVLPTAHSYHVLESPPASPYLTPVSSRSSSPQACASGGGHAYHVLEQGGGGGATGHSYHVLESQPIYHVLENLSPDLEPHYHQN